MVVRGGGLAGSGRPNFTATRSTAAALLLCVLLEPRPAGAAACCISATSFGVGRLLIWEDFAAGLRVGHSRTVGQWNPNGAMRWNPPRYSEGLSSFDSWAIVRVHERIQLQAWLPVLVNDRRSDTASQTAGGLGEVGVGARFEILSIGAYRGLPSLAVTVSATAPTGKRVEQTSAPLFAGTTGRGTWGGSLAVEAEYAFLPWFVRLDASASGFVPFDRADSGQRQQYGALFQVALSAGREIIEDRVVAALALTAEWETSLYLDGARVPDSAAHLYSLAASVSWRVHPHVTLTAALTNSIWPDGLGANRDARVGLSLGARYGYF